jgi:hypothetical protein
MKIFTCVFLFIILINFGGFGQKVISGKSDNTRLTINPVYTRGIPPNLFVEMSFEDDNNNLILEPNEKARLILIIKNKGKGPAQGLVVTVKDNLKDPEFKLGDGQEIPFLYPDNSIKVTIPIQAGFNIQSAEHKLEINVKEHFGYDMDPAFLILTTLKFQEPKIEFAGIQIIDAGEGTGALQQDGQLQAGELVKAKIVVQNTGQNISKNTKFNISTSDANIYISDGQGNLGDMGIGEVKEFWVTISPNKRVTTKERLPIYLTTTNDVSRGNIYKEQLPISLEQKPPEIVTMEVKPDIDRLAQQVARFEYNSNRITANVGNVIDIKQVLPSKTLRTDAVAVLIGLENYSYFAPAPYAENDATIMKEYFKNVLGIENIILYKSKNVTGYFFDNIFDPSFGELQKAVLKGKTDVFIYYSGHGIPNKEGDKVYLLPTDGRVEAIDRQGYDLNKLFQNLEALEARSVTIFMDACFSGISRSSETIEPENLLAMKGVRIKPDISEPWQIDPNFTLFTSSDYDQTSLGFDPSQTGLFTYYLCAGLLGKADADGDKKITAGELQDYVTSQVSETSVKIRGLQVPQFHGNRDTILAEY